MARDKAETAHVEHPEHEAALAGALALANLFSNCVEAFGLIHPAQRWDRPEQLLLARLGIQQARLLIWGDVVGIYSPPKTVTDRAVPKHPSAAYPDLKEPTFFGPRDSRLDEPTVRTEVEQALAAIVDRGSGLSREEMMEKFGLRPPKRFSADYQAPLDTNRLEHFRERYELLREVAEDYAHLHTRRNNSITHTSWQIADHDRFATFIELTQQQIDHLISILGVQDQIDRGMRMDIKAFGWHLTQDRMRVAMDVSKLQLVQEACREEYPQYLDAIQQALDHIEREKRENDAPSYAPPPMSPEAAQKTALSALKHTSPPVSKHAKENGNTGKENGTPKGNGNVAPGKQKRPGFFSRLKSFGKSKDNVHHDRKGRSKSMSEETPRSKSEIGPSSEVLFSSGTPNAAAKQQTSTAGNDEGNSLEPVRSKSVGDVMDVDEEFLKNRLQQMATLSETPQPGDDLANMISRHDQYHGIARTETKDLKQDW
ncbi:hypothetical protein KC332_g6948 [Hortaea werneckii]|uniref:Prion-inhibition and propagation HeLo domain-containing protein n=1 Tax=Hortaea werneckii TaxID=91943 RepID=A0A3M7J4M5_HORWE|nr:hypothetical protein KC358_g4463 [Hortaea werneckii]KAI6847002.1 hypothetical protein KC350_g3652 [Hortaea werneckii]KAI6939392.1 hypothetical protein KC341_g4234 [Hortaea werneckii]KAI6941530.1 hypothetical protein KC348_g4684 [Hortaea werneckii]KAI6975590.1 hypothetical protein KC321_g4454 [Hortaea werneckii]